MRHSSRTSTGHSRELALQNFSAGVRRWGGRWSRATSLIALALTLAADTAAAQTGILVGRVTNALTGAPVTTAHVTVTGTQITTPVDRDGRFRVTDVPVAAREVVARGLGFNQTAIAFSLTPNGTTAVTLAMTVSPLELDAIVVTGSVGDTRM